MAAKSSKKQRLDLLVQHYFPSKSRQQIQSLIMQGKVAVNGIPITKVGTPIVSDAVITLSDHYERFVSRAGFKLEKALDEFSINPEGYLVLDAGISTGGFTDCVLQRGAKKVFGVDVGYGQVHEKIRADKRVMLLERTNLRYLDKLDERVDLVTLDLSFISVLKVIDAVTKLAKDKATLIVLIKPQFEAVRRQVGRGGVIRDSAVHDEVIARVTEGIKEYGWLLQGVIESPLLGATGNKEFLACFVRS